MKIARMAPERCADVVLRLIDDLMQKGMFLCGSAETVRQQLEEYQKQIGFGYLLPVLQFATLPHDLTKRNLELFAEKVIPPLRPLGESSAPPRAS